MKWKLPRSVKVTELLCRDGLQHESHFIPTETKVYFVDAFSDCGFDTVEVTNFGHPRGVVQTRDAEEVLKRIQRKPGVTYKCYGMNRRAFERAAQTKQDGNGPDAVAFTISTTDEHCQRNAGRPVAQYLTEIPELVEIARSNGFEIDMAIACVFGCPITGPVPHAKAFEFIDRGLDMGIKKFTPCDTTGEASPERVYEFYTELKERYPKVDCHLAHFHNTRGKGLANTLAAIVGGAERVEVSLGELGGQPAFIVDRIVGVGTGPLYTPADIAGNSSTEDALVMLDEMGIDTGVDIDKVLQLGRLLEWVLERQLRPYTTRQGRTLKAPVKWSVKPSLEFIPPYKDGNWAYPRY